MKISNTFRATAISAIALGSAFLAVPASADIVHNDDVIITFSLCVGNDCVNGENFGFDTLRLKENNLRIHFDDTSTSASFPNNDWRIVANDTANGGANYLAFEDATAGRQVFRVEAGAPVNSLVVEADGDVGIKTSNPAVDLHIVEGNTPTVRLEQDGSDGFNPQTWDMAGNETNFFIRDATGGSQLPFRIRPGADTGALIIGANNYVGMGIGSSTTPDAPLQIRDTAGSGGQVMLHLENNGNPQILMNNTNVGEEWNIGAGLNLVIKNDGGPNVFTLSETGNLTITGTLTQSSDVNNKTAIVPVDSSDILAKVSALPVSSWSYKADAEDGIRHIGPMAQDFYAAFGTGADETGISSIDTGGVALAAIQALTAENEALKARLDALEQKMSDN